MNPLKDELAVAPADFAAHPQMKILVVDDEPLNLALLEDVLITHGYTRLQLLADPRQVLETCRTFAPDLVLLDLMMPFLDGFAVLELIRAAPGVAALPVIILTADANEKTKRRALRAGATDFILKPFDQTEVLLRINNVLETRRLQLQLEMQHAAMEDALRDRSLELRAAEIELQTRW